MRSIHPHKMPSGTSGTPTRIHIHQNVYVCVWACACMCARMRAGGRRCPAAGVVRQRRDLPLLEDGDDGRRRRTLRQRLGELCPVEPAARDKIVPQQKSVSAVGKETSWETNRPPAETDFMLFFISRFRGGTHAGAGECAAPKLLQYAYQNSLRPLCMSEFWWGNPPSSGSTVRVHGSYYPACEEKCRAILAWMLS